ncbi:calcitonin receptor [Elysia marginata]|uniref:Calcitonin receptor n=1 Tax=Elysia marginata TaxID=1093978 RepID=A0AAV4HIZ3_9GAST|nr:calcitonin receptor [Elysia marginata]
MNVLVRQLAPHPNEPNSFRRAFKALVIMMPSLGIQFLLFLWTKPEAYDLKRTIHDLLEEILCSLHGAFIALVFCYLNKEIQTHLKTPCQRMLRRNTWYNERLTTRSNTTTMTTQCVSDHSRFHREDGGNAAKRQGENGSPNSGLIDESLIPLQALPCSPVNDGQTGNNDHGQSSNGMDNRHTLNGELMLDDEVTHLDPGGHRD